MTTYVQHKMCNVVSESGKECDKPLGHSGMCINKTGCLVTQWQKTENSKLMTVDVICYVNSEWMEIKEIPFNKNQIFNHNNMTYAEWSTLINRSRIFSGTDM